MKKIEMDGVDNDNIVMEDFGQILLDQTTDEGLDELGLLGTRNNNKK